MYFEEIYQNSKYYLIVINIYSALAKFYFKFYLSSDNNFILKPRQLQNYLFELDYLVFFK